MGNRKYLSLIVLVKLLFFAFLTPGGTNAVENIVCTIDNTQMKSQGKTAGIAMNSRVLNSHEDAVEFAKIVQETGAKKVTRNLRWDFIETIKGTYLWNEPLSGTGMADSFTQALPADTVIFKLIFTPKWASSQPASSQFNVYPASNMNDWTKFVTAAVSRYGHGNGGSGKVRDWEIWNEPNANEYFMGDKTKFLEINNLAYDAIHSVDQTAVVWSPSLIVWVDTLNKTPSGYSVPNPGDAKYQQYQKLWDLFYLMIDQGKFDGFSFHAYGTNANGVDVIKALKTKISQYPQHANKKIMVSETNLSVGIPWTNCPYGPNEGQKSEQEQKTILEQRYACSFNSGADIVLWFPIQDRVNNNCPDSNLRDGLLRMDRSVKPAIEGFKKITNIITETNKPCPAPAIQNIKATCTPDGYKVNLTWNKVEGSSQYVIAFDDDDKFWSDTHQKNEFGEPVGWSATGNTTFSKSFTGDKDRYFKIRIGKSTACAPDLNNYGPTKSVKMPVCQSADLNRDSRLDFLDYQLIKDNFAKYNHSIFLKIVKKFNTNY